MMRLFLLLLVAGLPAGRAQAQADTTFARIVGEAQADAWHTLPIGDLMQRIGTGLLGAPYEAGLLDRSPDEPLVVDLERFDCVLFVETVLALARGVAVESWDFDGFRGRIEEQRYRDGRREGYCSRLHYFSEWILDNERRGIVTNVTAGLGGVPLGKRLDFMGTHRESYPLLADDSLYAEVLAMERRLEGLEILHVPQDRIRDVYPLLEAGDIVALTTRVEGLDVSHTGLVVDTGDGGRGLLHAALDRGVVLSPDLQSYVQNNRSQVGIVVARPRDPRTPRAR